MFTQYWYCQRRRESENMLLKKEEFSIKRGACIGQMMRKCDCECPVMKTMSLGPRQTDVSMM